MNNVLDITLDVFWQVDQSDKDRKSRLVVTRRCGGRGGNR